MRPVWHRWRKWITVDHMKFFPLKLSRLLSLIGALVLFSTFLIKEELKDHQKDLLADIQAAQAHYAEDERATEIVNTIQDLEVIRRTEGIARAAGDPQSVVQTRLQLLSDFRLLAEYGAAYKSAQSLKLSLSKKARADKADEAIDAIRQKLGGAMQAATPLAGLPESSGLTPDQSATIKQLHDLTSQLSQAVPTFVGEVLKKATEEENIRRERYEFWTTLSYFLYPIGWILAFCGSLLEPEKKEQPGADA